jgi:uncharacterized protein (TIGR03083 family)
VNLESAHDDHPSDPELVDHDAARHRFIDHILSDAERFAAAVRRGPLDSPVAACPAWDLRALTAHQGQVHRWARHSAANAAPPESFDAYAPDPDLDADALAAWLEAGVTRLVEVLRTIDLDGTTWHPFPVPRIGRVWPRRQAHEISIHRWDAEHAVGIAPAPIDPTLASDGVDEYLELVVPRLVSRQHVELPGGSLHLHCTDTHGEWLVTADPEYTLVRAHQKGDAALRGPAEALLLRLWNRPSPRRDELGPVGDERVLDAWLALTGL